MSQRTVVITGANSGIGKETAVALAAAGDRVVLACRNAVKAEAAAAEISKRALSTDVETVPLDLASFASIRECAAELERRCTRIDVLINNAGLILSKRELTAEGFEMTFGVNHLGHFLLTDLLRPLVVAADKPRVINVASAAHWMAPNGLKFNDLQSIRHYNGWVAYGRSKLANIYFSDELATRWKSDGVCVSSLHPGSVNSNFGLDGDTTGLSGKLMNISGIVTVSPVQGADTSVWLATTEAGGDLGRTGTYWSNRTPGTRAPWARRPAEATRLWSESRKLIDSSS